MGRSGICRCAIAALVFVLALAAAPNAVAHDGGKAEPLIAAGLSRNGGLNRLVTVRLKDRDSGEPVRGARVTAVVAMKTAMAFTAPARLSEIRPALYRGRIAFLHPGAWRVRITVTGKSVVAARATLSAAVDIQPSPGAVAPIATTFDDSLTRGDLSRMAVLWIHSLAAMGWIIGVLVMVVGLSTRPGVFAETARNRLASAYRDWGAWVHLGLVPVIVATGIYNMVYVTPFDLAWTPEEWRALGDIPYGYLYESILLVKLGLFGVLLLAGAMTLGRTVRIELPVVPVTDPHPSFIRVIGSILGPAGIVYLATVPLILGAAMALRYVHILSHVA